MTKMSESSEMVLRIAQVLLGAQNSEAFPNNINTARKILEAMREPTDNMRVAASDAIFESTGLISDGDRGDLSRDLSDCSWKAGIDAALSPAK